MGEGIMKLKMLEEQFKGNSVFYGGEEFVSFADIYIVPNKIEGIISLFMHLVNRGRRGGGKNEPHKGS